MQNQPLSQSPVSKKPQVIHVAFIVTLVLLFILPLVTGDSTNCFPDKFSWRCIFNVSKLNGDYDLGSIKLVGLYLDKYLIWDISALFQAGIFSFLLAVEAPARKVGKYFVLIYGFVILGVLMASLVLVFNNVWAYQMWVIINIIIFTVGDTYMWWKNKETIYKLLIFYVDLPILISLISINVIVSVPMEKDYHHFYSGAIAFQLLMGNLLIFLMRSHLEIESKNLGVPATFATLHKPSPDIAD